MMHGVHESAGKIDFGKYISYLVCTVGKKIIKQINNQEVHHGCSVSL
jgi:hypothetical protein